MNIKKILLLGLLTIISSCGNKQYFVVNKYSLDPFTIYNYPSLSLPPLYYLSSQEIADERRFLRKTNQEVKSLLYGNFTENVSLWW